MGRGRNKTVFRTVFRARNSWTARGYQAELSRAARDLQKKYQYRVATATQLKADLHDFPIPDSLTASTSCIPSACMHSARLAPYGSALCVAYIVSSGIDVALRCARVAPRRRCARKALPALCWSCRLRFWKELLRSTDCALQKLTVPEEGFIKSSRSDKRQRALTSGLLPATWLVSTLPPRSG